MTEEELAAIEARADDGCDGHRKAAGDPLFCPCIEQTSVDVRALLAEVRRLREQTRLGSNDPDSPYSLTIRNTGARP